MPCDKEWCLAFVGSGMAERLTATEIGIDEDANGDDGFRQIGVFAIERSGDMERFHERERAIAEYGEIHEKERASAEVTLLSRRRWRKSVGGGEVVRGRWQVRCLVVGCARE